jgi:hypothetical protein
MKLGASLKWGGFFDKRCCFGKWVAGEVLKVRCFYELTVYEITKIYLFVLNFFVSGLW